MFRKEPSENVSKLFKKFPLLVLLKNQNVAIMCDIVVTVKNIFVCFTQFPSPPHFRSDFKGYKNNCLSFSMQHWSGSLPILSKSINVTTSWNINPFAGVLAAKWRILTVKAVIFNVNRYQHFLTNNTSHVHIFFIVIPCDIIIITLCCFTVECVLRYIYFMLVGYKIIFICQRFTC